MVILDGQKTGSVVKDCLGQRAQELLSVLRHSRHSDDVPDRPRGHRALYAGRCRRCRTDEGSG